MNKIAVFYLISQMYDDWDKEFFIPQMELLKTSGLYDNINFIDIHISNGKLPLPFIPDKIRNIHYLSDTELAEKQVLYNMWNFCNKNPGYKILYFHSSGITLERNTQEFERKQEWRKYMEFCNISLWKYCKDLLDFYDCVGTDYVPKSWFRNGEIVFRAPHYPGNFWWSNSLYIKKLDLDYLEQEEEYKRYLSEFWLFSNNPKYYNIYNIDSNHYQNLITFSKENIEHKVSQDLFDLKTNPK